MAEYRIIEHKDGTYGVAVLRPPKVTETDFGDFRTADEARAWVEQQKAVEVRVG